VLPGERAARPAVPGCLTGRICLRGPVRCPVPDSAAAVVTVTM